MSLAINDNDVVGVLLQDGWHSVSNESYEHDETSFTLRDFDTEDWLAGPISSVLAVRYDRNEHHAESPQKIHGHCPTVDGRTKPSPTWRAWSRMREDAKRLGIVVDSRWDRFEGFLDAMGARPDGHVLGRPSALGYCPAGCQWVPRGTCSRPVKDLEGTAT